MGPALMGGLALKGKDGAECTENGILFCVGLIVECVFIGHELHLSPIGEGTKKLIAFVSRVLICRCSLVILCLSSKKRLISLLTSVS